MSLADARAVAEVHVASWRAAYADIIDFTKVPLDVDERERSWAHRIPLVGDEGNRTWVAELQGRIVGFAFTQPTEDDDLNPLFDDPDSEAFKHLQWLQDAPSSS